MRSFEGSSVVKSSCKVFFNWFWLWGWCNIVGVFWFVNLPVSCVCVLI